MAPLQATIARAARVAKALGAGYGVEITPDGHVNIRKFSEPDAPTEVAPKQDWRL